MIFYNNYADAGGGLMANHGNPLVDSCIFIDNTADYGGAMFFNNSAGPVINRTLFHGNIANDGGGGLFAEAQVNSIVANCTFSDNSSPEGGGIDYRNGSLTITNSIIAFSGQDEAISVRGTPTITITYCDLYGNVGGDWTGPLADQLGINGNVCLDPLFVDHSGGDCRLFDDSPCIDAGDPASPYDPDSTIADMGAYYFDQLTDIKDSNIPRNYLSVSNYPNPFNSTTTIRYILPEPSEVSIYIYDLIGREVESFLPGYRSAGAHLVKWNAGELTSGIYFIRIETIEYSIAHTMLYIK